VPKETISAQIALAIFHTAYMSLSAVFCCRGRALFDLVENSVNLKVCILVCISFIARPRRATAKRDIGHPTSSIVTKHHAFHLGYLTLRSDAALLVSHQA